MSEAVRDNTLVEIHNKVFVGLDVKRVIFHQSVDVPGGFGQASSLYAKRGPGTGRSAISDVKMTYNDGILACEIKGNAFLIPVANIVVMYL